MDDKTLKKRLKLLKTAGISTFKCKDFEVSFHVEQPQTVYLPAPTAQDTVIDAPEPQMPVDLRAEKLNDHEHILNWSSGLSDEEVPLTGDRVLS